MKRIDMRTGFQAVLDVVRKNPNASTALVAYRVRRKCITRTTVTVYVSLARQVVIPDKKKRLAVGRAAR